MSNKPPSGWAVIPALWAVSIMLVFVEFLFHIEDRRLTRACETAFGSDARGIEHLSDGVLCHVDGSTSIATHVDHENLIDLVHTYLATWPTWVTAVFSVLTIASIVIIFVSVKRMGAS